MSAPVDIKPKIEVPEVAKPEVKNPEVKAPIADEKKEVKPPVNDILKFFNNESLSDIEILYNGKTYK